MSEKIFSSVTNDFPPVFDENARVLILGSLPSVASRAAGFYYMNPQNRFWKMLSALYGEPFPEMSKEEKIRALKRRGVALYDVIGSCRLLGSSDSSIKDAECTDIPYILQNSKIKKILLNGTKAHSLFLKFYPSLADLAQCLPSTSPANAKFSLSDLVHIWGEALK